MNDCFSESQIKNFYAGMCTDEESRAIQSHLYGCGACTAHCPQGLDVPAYMKEMASFL